LNGGCLNEKNHEMKIGNRTTLVVLLGVVVWFLISEAVTFGWYSVGEGKLSKNRLPVSGEELLSGSQKFIEKNGGIVRSVKGIGDVAAEMLKCDFGETLTWSMGANFGALTIIKWNDASVVSGVEGMHNPGNCLAAAGWKIGEKHMLGLQEFCDSESEVTEWDVERPGLRMRAFSCVFRKFRESVSNDRSNRYWNSRRMEPVLDGRRDAPRIIVLVYLPIDFTSTEGSQYSEFTALMNATFCGEEKSPINES